MATEFGVIGSKSVLLSNEGFAKTVFDFLANYAKKTALIEVWSSREVTFSDLKSKSELVARHLLKIGVRKGDVVGIYAPNSIDWVVACLGIMRIGGIIAAINCLLKKDELKHQLVTSGAKVLFTASTLVPLAMEWSTTLNIQVIVIGGSDTGTSLDAMTNDNDKHLPGLPTFEDLRISLDDPVLIAFSSGTTGPQKAVLLSNRNLESGRHIACYQQTKITHPTQVIFAPMSHVAGLFRFIYGLVDGSLSYLLQGFDINIYLKLLQDLEITNIAVVPPIAVLLAKSPQVDNFRLKLKLIICGAAPLSGEIENQLKRRFPGVKISQVYGMTESTATISMTPVNETASSEVQSKTQSVGPPCVNMQMKVVDDNGKALGSNRRGEICIKGPSVMLGYLGNPEATTAAIDRQGWLHTGDIGYYDEDGHFYVVDRLKELIKYKAYQVAPAELEAVLLSHPKIADAGVIGLPDPDSGELPMAWIVRKPNVALNEKEVEQFVSDRVAPYKRLRGGIRFVDSIPKSASGKILRNIMRSELLRGKL